MFRVFTLSEVEANCYVIGDCESGEIVLIDPGFQPSDVVKFIQSERLTVKYVINTHGHIDHIAGNREILEAFKAPLCIHQLDSKYLEDPTKNLSLLFGMPITSPPADILLKEGQKLELSDMSFEIIHTPGHTPGSICLKTPSYILTGDTLFKTSIGRTDIPGGSAEQLMKSIKEKLLPLDKGLLIYPGHGPQSTLREEIDSNPFF